MQQIGSRFKVNNFAINDDLIPFAIHLDEYCVLTKNGELMQTIEITSFDNTKNLDDTFFKEIRTAIFNQIKSQSENYSFWSHTIRKTNEEIFNYCNKKIESSNAFISEMSKEWSEQMKSFNYYDSVLYITIVRSGVDISLAKNFGLYLNKNLLFNHHKKKILQIKDELNSVITGIIPKILNCKIKRLKIEEIQKRQYQSQNINFFYYLFNLQVDQTKIPICNISSAINQSTIEVNFDYIKLTHSKTNTQAFASIFTVKDSFCVNGVIVSEIFNNSKNIISCEISHPDYNKNIIENYKKQLEQMRSADDKEFFKKTKIDQEMPKNNTHKITQFFLIYASTKQELDQSVSSFSSLIGSVGIVAAKETFGLERAFYSLLPANFQQINHSQLCSQNEVFKFSYSYSFDNENIQHYLDKKPVTILSTIKNNSYAFGIDFNKPDIAMFSNDYSKKTTLTNFLISNIIEDYQPNVLILSTKVGSETFINAIDGKNYNFDQKQNHNIDLYNLIKTENLQNIFEDLLNAAIIRAKLTTNYNAQEIKELGQKTITNTPETLEEIKQSLLNTTAKDVAFLFEKEGFIEKTFHYKEEENLPPIPSQVYRERYYINESISKNKLEKEITAFFVLERFLSIASTSDHPTIIVIDNPLFLFDNIITKKLLTKATSNTDHRSYFFIFNIGVEDFFINEIKIQEINKTTNTSVYFSDMQIKEEECEKINLEKAEFFALQRLSNKPNNLLLKQSGIIVPIDNKLHLLHRSIKEIICDNFNVVEKMNLMKENYQQNWLNEFIKKEESEEQAEKREMAEKMKKFAEKEKSLELANKIIKSA